METGSKNEQRVIGARDLKDRLGVFLMQGLVVSMFLHSAVMGIVGLWPKSQVVDSGYTYQDTIFVSKPPVVLIPPRPSAPKPTPPAKPDAPKYVPTDEPLVAIDTLPEPQRPEDYPALHGTIDPNAIDSGGEFTNGGSTLFIDTADQAGFVKPWEIFQPREIEPKALSTNPIPEFPKFARMAGTEGQVLIWVHVSDRGDVLGWNVINVNPPGLGFEDAVATVIPKWKFTPAIQQNAPVAVWVVIPFNFKVSE